MENLKKALFFKLVDNNWLTLHYANEKFDLFFHNENKKNQNNSNIKFHLSNKNNHHIYLSGIVYQNQNTVQFEFNEQESEWFKSREQLKAKVKKENVTDLLENLFCSMLIQGDSK